MGTPVWIYRAVTNGESHPVSRDGGPLKYFSQNPIFVAVLHEIVRRYAPDEPGIDAEAWRIGDGMVHVIDTRTPDPDGRVPTEDIVGRFEVRDGAVVRDAYVPNPDYRLLSENGLMSMSDTLHQRLIAEIARRTTDA